MINDRHSYLVHTCGETVPYQWFGTWLSHFHHYPAGDIKCLKATIGLYGGALLYIEYIIFYHFLISVNLNLTLAAFAPEFNDYDKVWVLNADCCTLHSLYLPFNNIYLWHLDQSIELSLVAPVFLFYNWCSHQNKSFDADFISRCGARAHFTNNFCSKILIWWPFCLLSCKSQ